MILVVSSSRPGAASAQDSLKRAEQLRAEAQAHFRDGQFAVGISKAREALAISEKILPPNDVRLANPLFDLAQILQAKAHYTEARTLYERAVKIIELDRGPDHPDVGSTLDRLGALLLIMGDRVAAKAAAERAIAILEKALHPQDPRLIPALNIMARIRMGMGDFQGAKAAVERALNIIGLQQRKAKVPARVSALLRQTGVQMLLLGAVHQRLRDDSAARNAYQEALKASEGAFGPDHPIVAIILTRLAELSYTKGEYAAAKPSYERALAIARKSTAPEIQRQAALGLAQINEKENRLIEAVALYQEAIRVLEGITGQFEEDSARGRYLQAGNKLAAYDALAQLLLKLHEQDNSKGYDREAWAILDAKKNRVAAEAMTASRPKLQDPEVRQEVEKASDFQAQAAALERALAAEQAKPLAEQESARVKSMTTLLAQTKSDYLKQVQAFLTRYPQYRTQFVDQQTVDPKALAKFADRLPAGTLAIQLFPSPDALYIFAVAPGGYFKVKSQALAQSELYRMIKEYRQYLARAATQRLPWNDDGSDLYRENLQPFKEVTKKLSAHMFGPIESELREYKNLVIIPNDMLLYLPIHALTRNLPDGSTRFLSETHVVSYLTQLELADLVNPVAPDAKAALLALSNPDGSLPAASREVREIGKIRPSVTTLDGAQATKERFLSLAGKFPDIHLATHGVLDSQRPENSYLLMAGPDQASQHLTIGEIAGLRLAPNGLAILSACETAVGEQVPGAALITLSAAFSQAGSQSIMASLWKVEDSATRDLMIAFHGGLAKVGRAVALQQAQLAVLKNPGTAHPYYWAPFILIGGR
jgi:CHAT domain-containing protein